MKKLIAIVSLLLLLTSCGSKDKSDEKDILNSTGTEIKSDLNGDENINLDITEGDMGTEVSINASGSVDEDQILEDINNIVNQFIDSAENVNETTTNTGVNSAS